METHISASFFPLHALEPTHLIKIYIPELGALDHLPIEATFELHHVQEHLVVAASGEEDLARVQLIERASNGPDVQRRVVRDAEN